MPIKEIKARLIQRIKRNYLVESFRFHPAEEFNFLPGQAGKLIFNQGNKSDKELNKYLSFSSSPAKKYIEFTKKLSDSLFSQSLKKLKADDEILIYAPIGQCVFKDNYKKIAFLIGGIGITPVVSIIEYIMDNKLDTQVQLFYSNRTEDDIVFKQELDSWQSANKNIRIYYTVTDCQPKDKICHFGLIDKKLLKENICDINEKVIFIFGPPGMVDTMYELSLGLGCSKDNIKTERFIGY